MPLYNKLPGALGRGAFGWGALGRAAFGWGALSRAAFGWGALGRGGLNSNPGGIFGYEYCGFASAKAHNITTMYNDFISTLLLIFTLITLN